MTVDDQCKAESETFAGDPNSARASQVQAYGGLGAFSDQKAGTAKKTMNRTWDRQ